ncbi:hypothetical protein QOZ80_5AG0362540 [Eleusine coracana subsp. coracana]|nr:hypothetical protein QOZ80_5AG0362540 [Eleusine coracana subsp. coracana]
MENSLASELARVQTMVRELEANMDRQDLLPPAAREICDELASRVDRSLRMARSWLPESPGSADGSPLGHDTAGTGNAVKDAHFKRRKGVPSVRKQVRVTSVQDTAPMEDGFSWRKYGQKDILGAKYPRAYFRCTHRNTQSCHATKQVQRVDGDPLLFDVVYHGAHTCVQAANGRVDQLQQQPGHAAGQEQSSQLVLESGGLHAGFEPMTPLHFTSTPAGTDLGGGYPPLLSPTSLEWQVRSSHAAAGFGDGGMDVEHQYEELFSYPPESFQWEFQDLYAANYN